MDQRAAQPVVVPSPSLISQGFSSRVVMPECNGVGLPLVIGEAPGKTEDDTGIPFHPEAEAGGLFKRLMSRVGVERTRFNIANVVMQRPPYNELYDAKGYPMAWTHEAIEYWKPFLHQTIEELQPPVIIGLGRTALETLTGFTDIGTTRGYVTEARINLPCIEACRYCVGGEPDCFICGGTGKDDGYDRKSLHIPTICTYHPAFLNYGQRHLSGVFIRDVLAALEIAESGWEAPSLKVTPSPSPEAFRAFCEGFQPSFHKLTADIETPDTRGEDESTLEDAGKQTPIDRMSFCYATEIGGFSVPFEEPFLTMAKDLIARAKVLRGWNWRLFDWPRLTQHGFTTQAREEDLIDCWRHLHRTLPASVAFVAPFYVSMPPWKHEAHSQPEYYSAMDAIVTHLIGEGMEREMRASGQWETYQRHVVEIISTNHGVCTQMAKNGLPIDPEKIVEFQKELEQKHKERLARLQELVPEPLKPVKQKNGLKKVPKSLEGCIRRRFVVKLGDATKEERACWIERQPRGTGIGEDDQTTEVERWALLESFNPASHLQVKALIRHYGHKAKTDRKTKNETSSDDTLKSLVMKYVESKKASDVDAVEAYRLIRECRAIDKVLGTYVKGWKPASDGLIHATPGIWGDMFRISWRKPNLAATVADKKEIQIAAGFRKCICVGDQDVIIESDWKGMEALLVGYFAGDQDYMRLARLGVHDFMGHHMMKLPISMEMSDDELSDRFKWFKQKYPKDRDDAKHCIAEGQPVLTDTGLVPIQNITLANKVWDGVEFVSHGGLVDQGVREVITYAGLTATPDHQVFTKDGRITTLGLASTELERLQRTGIGGQALWSLDRLLHKNPADKRLHPSSVPMHEVWQEGLGQQVQFAEWEDKWLSLVLPPAFTFPTGVGESLFEHHRTLQQRQESGVQELWRPWHKVPVYLLQTLPRVGVDQPTPPYLSKNHDRPSRQQWPLCSGEPKASHATRADDEHEGKRVDDLSWATPADARVCQSLRMVMDIETGSTRADGGGDHRERESTCPQGSRQELASAPGVARRARVYDILNAGPRHRFTVSDHLVHNCVHGVGYGMTAYLMAELYEMTRNRAQQLIDLLFHLFPKVKQWQQATMQKAHDECKLVNAWGYRMPFWNVFAWQQKRYERLRMLWVRFKTDARAMFAKRDREAVDAIAAKVALGVEADAAISSLCYDLGDEAKSALAFLPRDTGAAMLKDTLLALRDEYGLDQRVLRANAHDSILAICPRKQADEVAWQLQTTMQRPQMRLGGLIIGAEVSIGMSWDKASMKEWQGAHALSA